MADEPLTARTGEAPDGRGRAVLFVDISGSTHLYHSLGDAAALDIVTRCLAVLEEQVYEHRGRVVKTIGDALMCVFPEANAAVTAAVAMQQTIEHYGAELAVPVAVKVGLYAGPVIEERGDVFGDAVNVAARLADLAHAGQIITDAVTLTAMRVAYRRRSRAIDRTTVRGKPGELEIVEIGWRRRGGAPFTTEQAGAMQAAKPLRMVVRFAGRDHVLGPDLTSFTFGRDPSSSVPVDGRKTSRQHARIERRRDRFVLFDHSTNGTWVAIEGEPDVLVRRESFLLRGRGVFSLGERPVPGGAAQIAFECD